MAYYTKHNQKSIYDYLWGPVKLKVRYETNKKSSLFRQKSETRAHQFVIKTNKNINNKFKGI